MAEIIVDQTDLNITITPNTTQLNVFTGGYACAQGNTTEFQYNNGGVLAGANGLTYNSGTQTTTSANLAVTNDANLGAVGNVTITGGNVNQFLQTDGAGGLSFADVANANYANFAGTVLTNAQPNITSVGNLSNLTVTGNVTANYYLGNGSQLTGIAPGDSISNGTSNVRVLSANGSVAIGVNGNANILVANATGITVTRANLGSVANLNITGGNNGMVLQTDGTGNLTWTAMTGNAGNGTVGGSNTQIQYNDGGAFGGSAGFTFNKASNLLNAPGGITAVGNVQGSYIKGDGGLLSNIAGGAFIANGNSNVGIFTANGNATISVAGNSNIVTITGTGVNVSGTLNVTGNLTGILSNGNSNISITANGNVRVSAIGNANIFVVTGTGVNVAGTLNATSNANVGNLGTGGFISATGNITGGNVNTAGKVVASALESNVATGTAPLVVASTTKVTNLNADLLDGYNTDTAATANTVVVRNADGNIAANNISGTLSTAAQPSITSVGTLSSLNVSGTITGGNIYANAGTIGGSSLTGTLTTAAQPNVTSLGNLTALTIVGTTKIQQAIEKVTIQGAATGTINFNLLDQAIILTNANATANFTLNFRGNSSTTLNTMLSDGNSITASFINLNGANGFYANIIQIDGSNVTTLWSGNTPNVGTTNGRDVYTFNIIKTANNTYTVLGSQIGFD